jgi:hypothetical protein
MSLAIARVTLGFERRKAHSALLQVQNLDRRHLAWPGLPHNAMHALKWCYCQRLGDGRSCRST